jgi:hypothetical protein
MVCLESELQDGQWDLITHSSHNQIAYLYYSISAANVRY